MNTHFCVYSRTIEALLVALMLDGRLLTPQQDPWTGQAAILKQAVTRLAPNPGDPGSIKIEATFIVRIERTEGSWACVRVGARSGWIPKRIIVLLPDAIPYFTERIRRNPQDTSAYFSRATAYHRQGKLDLALKDLNKIVELEKPTDPMLFNARATLWTSMGEFEKALADYSEAIRLAPDSPAPYFNRALLWESRGAMKKALADYSQSITNGPDRPESYVRRGCLLAKRGQKEKASHDFGIAVKLEPTNASYRVLRGCIEADLGNLDNAIRDFTEALRLDQNCTPAHAARAMAWRLKKQYGKALADFEATLRRWPTHAESLRGMALILASCPDSKLRDGQRAVELARRLFGKTGSWKDPEDLETLAAAYAQAGEFGLAVKWEMKFLEQELEPTQRKVAESILKLYKNHKPRRDK